MVKKENKLKLDKDFEALFKNGKGVNGTFFGVKVLFFDKEKGVFKSKFGFVVPKKVAKSAVVRNKIKRKTSEIVRKMIKKGLIKQNFYVSLVARHGAIFATSAEIEADLVVLFTKTRLFC